MNFQPKIFSFKTWWRVRLRHRRRRKFQGEFAPRLEREEEAASMLPHTKFGRGVAASLTVAFLLPALAFALIRDFPRAAPNESGADAADKGTKIGGVTLPFKPGPDLLDNGRPYTQLALTKYLRASNSQVIVGQDHWLYYGLGVQHVIGPGFLDQEQLDSVKRQWMEGDPRPAMLQLRDDLKARGIDLVLLPIPDKTTIYPEELNPSYAVAGPAPENASYQDWKTQMQGQGLKIFDTTDTLLTAKTKTSDLIYVPTDSHWTPRAAQYCAQGLAAFIRGSVCLPDRAGVNYSAVDGRTHWPHDMVNLLGLPANQTLYDFPYLPLRSVIQPNGNIFASDPKADILMIGDSFLGFYENGGASLAAETAYELKRPVQYVSIPNGGSWASRLWLKQQIEKGQDPLIGKKLVVWEFTARDFSSGDWKSYSMPAATSPGAGAATSLVACKVAGT